MRSRRARRRIGCDARTAGLLLVAGLCAFAPTSAWAAETPEEAQKRLDDRFFFVKALNRGGDALIADIRTTIGAVGKAEPLLAIQGDACLWRGQALLASKDEGDETRAFDYLLSVAEDQTRPVDMRQTANGSLVEIWVRRGERLEGKDDKQALKAYESALDRDPEDPRPYKRIGGLSARNAEAFLAVDAFDDALQLLRGSKKRIEPKLGNGNPEVKVLERMITGILDTTGVVSVRWLGELESLKRVKGATTVFVGGKLAFAPQGGGRTPPSMVLEPGTSQRIRQGRYDVTVNGDGDGSLALFLDLPKEGAAVVVPAALPDGMVYVPEGDGIDAFLMDRFEVSNAQFRPFARDRGVSFTDGNGDHPARGMTFDAARSYADWAGKRLPNAMQWDRAAFGAVDGSRRTYPWGESSPAVGTHFVGGRRGQGPLAVDACAAGESAFGVRNLAGNVMEWIEPGWAIGGSFTMSTPKVSIFGDDTFRNWELDFLRDPIPTQERFDDENLPAGRDRSYYKPDIRIANQTYYDRTGVRCVIPLGKPREAP